jgi:tetratricopeptide (TPR) repeat protein
MMNWRKLLITAFVISIFSATCFAGAGSDINKGNKLYKQSDYDGALKQYRDAQISSPDSSVVHFDLGDALYKTNSLDDAQTEFNKALASKNPIVRSKAYYNLGNNAFKNQKNDEAIDYYKKSLMLNPKDEDAKYNLEYLTKVKNQPQKKNKNDKKKDQDKKQQQKNKDKNNDQQQQNKNGMSKEDAKRILQSFDNADKNSLKKRRAAQPPMPKTDEDW